MTREEAKKYLPILEAYANGKIIQRRNGDAWFDMEGFNMQFIPDAYRIAPEPEYVPFGFEDRELFRDKWLKSEHGDEGKIIAISVRGVSIGVKFSGYNEAFRLYTFLDGTPFGKLKGGLVS